MAINSNVRLTKKSKKPNISFSLICNRVTVKHINSHSRTKFTQSWCQTDEGEMNERKKSVEPK